MYRLVLLLALASPSAAAIAQQPTRAQAAAPAAAATVEVEINGLVCDFCIQALTRSFRRNPAVERFDAHMGDQVIRIAFKPGRTLDDDAIRRIVRNAGYDTVAIRRQP